MANQITVETLTPVTHNHISVITTELLAQLYATKPDYIRRNHHRNSERFVEGKHYFVAKGEALENLKKSLRPFQEIAQNVRKLILWTERGAARHAKMLETDQAWEVFERLEDCYFSRKLPPATKQPGKYSVLIHFDDSGEIAFTQTIPGNAVVDTLDGFIFRARKHGWLIMKPEDLLAKLAL